MNQWIQDFLSNFGVVGIGLLMFFENVFPPIPSEIVMPWAGYAVSKGDITFAGAVTAGSLGSFAGAFTWFWFARWVGKKRLIRWIDRHGWWLTISSREIETMDKWFERWGHWAVLGCRMIPGLRTLISVPAGFVAMPMGKFCLYTAIGTMLWTALLAGLGWWLADNFKSLVEPLGWVSTLVVGGMFVWWLFRLAKVGLIKAHR